MGAAIDSGLLVLAAAVVTTGQRYSATVSEAGFVAGSAAADPEPEKIARAGRYLANSDSAIDRSRPTVT